MRTSTRVLSMAGAFTLAAVALTGCAASMTKEQACDYLETEITAYTATVQDDLTEASKESDLDKIVEIRKTMLAKYVSIGNGANNAEVKASFFTLTSAMEEIFPHMEKLVDDPTAKVGEDYTDVIDRINDAGEKFSKVCPGGNSDFLG